MNHAHHEYLFDFRHKDLDTGKLNIDKLTTLNSYTNIYDLMESEASGCYEYSVYRAGSDAFNALEEQYNAVKFPEREAQRQKEKEANEAYLAKLQQEHDERQRERRRVQQEFAEYHARLRQREQELIEARERRIEEQKRNDIVTQYSIVGGQRIITSQWKKQG